MSGRVNGRLSELGGEFIGAKARYAKSFFLFCGSSRGVGVMEVGGKLL